ncbi:MAG: chemotaxis protein CheX [Chloroflexi bacterium]|nr:chemotaxis protein CheX [Chloroflexota bacterium]
MKEEYVNSFLVPARLVWKKELGEDLAVASAEVVSHQFTTEDLTAIIGVSGRLEGNVLYGWTEDSAIKVVSRMIGEDLEDLRGDLALSALGELANMITGNAATHLAQGGYPCQISPPVIVEPRGSRFTITGSSQILVSFTSPLASLSVRISLRETANPD